MREMRGWDWAMRLTERSVARARRRATERQGKCLSSIVLRCKRVRCDAASNQKRHIDWEGIFLRLVRSIFIRLAKAIEPSTARVSPETHEM